MCRLIFRLAFFSALAAISYLALAPITETPVSTGWDKLNHASAFFCLLLLMNLGFPLKPSFWFKVALLFVYGVAIEVAQSFIPPRESSLLDLFANGCGLAFYVLINPFVQRIFATSQANASNMG